MSLSSSPPNSHLTSYPHHPNRNGCIPPRSSLASVGETSSSPFGEASHHSTSTTTKKVLHIPINIFFLDHQLRIKVQILKIVVLEMGKKEQNKQGENEKIILEAFLTFFVFKLLSQPNSSPTSNTAGASTPNIFGNHGPKTTNGAPPPPPPNVNRPSSSLSNHHPNPTTTLFGGNRFQIANVAGHNLPSNSAFGRNLPSGQLLTNKTCKKSAKKVLID